MLKDEFRPIDGKVLTIGRSPKEKIYMVPKSCFDLPKKKELRNSAKFSHHDNRKRIDFMGLFKLGLMITIRHRFIIALWLYYWQSYKGSG